MRKNYSLIPILIITPIIIFSQTISIGGTYALSGYQGDVNERVYTRFRQDKVSVGGFVRYHFNDKFRLRANVYEGNISGADYDFVKPAWRQIRRFSFKTHFKEMSAIVEYNFIKDIFPRLKDPAIAILGFIGVGYTMTDPQPDFNEPNAIWEDVSIDKFAEYNRNILVFPVGAGIDWRLSPSVSVGVECGLRKTFTDYLDGISKTAQPNLKDWYFLGGASVSYNLSNLLGKPKHRYKIRTVKAKCPYWF